MSDAVFSDPLDLKKVETRAWFEHLRDRIHAAFEALEDAAPADLFPGAPGKQTPDPAPGTEGAATTEGDVGTVTGEGGAHHG